MKVFPRARDAVCGISYPEVLAATLLLTILLVPAMQALHSGVTGSTQYQQQLVDYYALHAKMEAVLARPYSQLNAAAAGEASPSTLSDTYVTVDGRSIQRQVYIAGHDLDNADADNDLRTGTDPGILWVKVAIANSAQFLETLVTP